MAKDGRYTLQDVMEMQEDTITPAIAGDVLGCTGHLLGRMCHEEPEKIQFNFQCIGVRTIIPRMAFVNWMQGRDKKDR